MSVFENYDNAGIRGAKAQAIIDLGIRKKPESRGDWMQTFTGKAMYPTDPRPEEIFILDIAHSLSKQCRYAGHCIKFYSVAEHCVHVSKNVSERLKLTALLHDASEAYLVDLPRPLKYQIPQYREIEGRLEKVISEKYNLVYPFPDEIKNIDNRMLTDERIQNMAPPPMEWKVYEQNGPVGVTLEYWSPDDARKEFLDAFYEYGGK